MTNLKSSARVTGFFGLFLLCIPAASASKLHPRVDASYVHPRSSESAFEAGVAALDFVDSERAFELGPHASYLAASADGQTRHATYLGGESSLWMMNVFGAGLGADWVASSSLENDHFRIEPMLDIRMLHVGTQGALALRIGAPYEQSLQWGFRAGVTLELLGI